MQRGSGTWEKKKGPVNIPSPKPLSLGGETLWGWFGSSDTWDVGVGQVGGSLSQGRSLRSQCGAWEQMGLGVGGQAVEWI